MLSYIDPNGVVHPNLNPQEAMQFYRDNGFSGQIEEEADTVTITQEEPDIIEAKEVPTRMLVPVTATSTNLEVRSIEPPTPPVSVEEEEEDFANMRGRKFSSARDQFTTKTLEEVLANLEDLEEKEDPQDYLRNANGFIVKFKGEQPSGQFMFRGDAWGEPIRINRKAYRELCSSLGGAGALRTWDRQLRLRGGDKLTEMCMGLFRTHYNKNHLFRTALGKDGRRHLNAMLSETYSTYDNSAYIKDVIMCLGEDLNDWHVIRYDCRDGRLHVQLVHVEDAYTNNEVGVPVPALTLRNGIYGDGSSLFAPSIFNKWCSNGCYHFNAKTTKRWNHTGDSGSRIRRDLPGLVEDMLIDANGLLKAYNDSLIIEIDDAYKWFETMVENTAWMTTGLKEEIRTTMLNNPTVHGNGRLLTSVPDAITYVAHEQINLGKQMKLERLGGELLHRGLQQAENNRILLPIG